MTVYGRAWHLCKESAVIADQELEICNSIYPLHKIELSAPKQVIDDSARAKLLVPPSVVTVTQAFRLVSVSRCSDVCNLQ